MEDKKPDLEKNVRDSYKERTEKIGPFCSTIPAEAQKYFRALTEYNALTGETEPEQNAAIDTGLLLMAGVLDELKQKEKSFAYAMAETLFRNYAKEEAGWDDTQIEAYFKKVEDNQKLKAK